MSWSAIESTVRSLAEQLRPDLPNLCWLMAVRSRPAGEHVTYTMLIDSTTPMEIGSNLSGEPYSDRVEGRLQFDVYVPVGSSIDAATGPTDAIRAHFRGLREGSIRFQTPSIQLLGTEAGYTRWTVDCPFIAEEC